MNTQKNFSFATKKTVLKGKHLPIGLSFLSYKTTDLQYSILPSEEDIMLSFSAQMKSFAKQKLPLHPTIFLALRCLKNSTQKHSHHSNSLQVKLFPVFESIFAFRNSVFSSISLYYFQFSKFQVSFGYHEWVSMCPFDSGLEIYKKYDTPLYFTKIQPFSVSYKKYYYYLIQLIHNISSQICQSYHFNIFFSNITFYQAQLLKFISNYQSILFINIISRLKTTHSIPEFS